MDLDVIHWGQVAAALGAILTVGGMLVKWTIVKPIKMYIDQMTYPIQPSANGGNSLPDLVKSVAEVKDLIVSHLAHHDTQN